VPPGSHLNPCSSPFTRSQWTSLGVWRAGNHISFGPNHRSVLPVCALLIITADSARVSVTRRSAGLPLGGWLAHPERHLGLTGPFWLRYPFALPCFVGAAFALVASIGGQLFLAEVGCKEAAPGLELMPGHARLSRIRGARSNATPRAQSPTRRESVELPFRSFPC